MCVIRNFLLSSLSSKTELHFSVSRPVTAGPAICEANGFMYYDMKCTSFIHVPPFIYGNTSQEMSECSIIPFKRSM